GDLAARYTEIGANVVREVAKLKLAIANAVTYDEVRRVIAVSPPDQSGKTFYLHPATVRRNDRSAASVDEWTGEQRLDPRTIPEDVQPDSLTPVGNYAVQISWPDGLNQIATFDLLCELERLVPPTDGSWDLPSKPKEELSGAQQILQSAQSFEAKD
ncbi:hypothetical protein CYMTET_17845, partial [Cymbomonas tetramitiformis]